VKSGASLRIDFARLIRASRVGVCKAAQISIRCCRFSQKPGVLPKTLASISAVSAVIERLFAHSSLMVFRLTPIAAASCP
jgi:hypothetical protein